MDGVNAKMTEAKHLISTQILPEIEKSRSQMDDEINSLVEQVVQLRVATEAKGKN